MTNRSPQKKLRYPINLTVKSDAACFIEKYKTTLNLKRKDMIWLSNLCKIDNIFNSQESVDFEITRIYLQCIRAVNKQLKKQNSSFEKRIKLLDKIHAKLHRNLLIRPHFHHKEYEDFDIEKNVYRYIYLKAECLIRRTWGVRVRINPEYFSPVEELQNFFHAHLGNLIHLELCKLNSTVTKPDKNTEIMLNQLDTNRWKDRLKLISAQCANDRDRFARAIFQLVQLNNNNPNKHLIFFEAAKKMMLHSRFDALRFYLYYLYDNPNKLNTKSLNFAMRKKLILNSEQELAFERMIVSLHQSLSLDHALENLKEFCTLS